MNHKDDFTKAGTLENLPSPSKGNPFQLLLSVQPCWLSPWATVSGK